MGRILLSTTVWALVVASARAVDYVTDMPLFSSLAPCVQDAISYNILSQTYGACPDGPDELQSCVCTKNKNLASISSRISASISYDCGSTASDDQSSAQTVLSAYCDPSATYTFATPTAVSAYITELPEVGFLAPCAQSALKWAFVAMTNSLCPSDAPALASCACLKNRNSARINTIISSSAKYSCSSHTADISSAQAMFAAYCAMNNGTTNLPMPSNPPGDMTYYVTDLPQFSSLAPCAASALSYVVQSQAYDLCPSGPQALASCVCIKDGMTNDVLKSLTSSVKYSCDSTATEDVSSAVAVYDFYCSAAQAKVTAAGVTNSVEQTYPESRTPGSPQQTGGSGSGSGSGSGNGNGSGSGSGGSGDGNGAGGASDGSDRSSSGPSTPVIVGAVVGVVGGLALIGAGVFFVMREVRKRRNQQLPIPDSAHGGSGGGHPLEPYGGKAELPHDPVASPPPHPPASPSPSTLKVAAPTRVDNVSPVSANTAAFTPPPLPHNQAELSGQPAPYPPMPNRPELQGGGSAGSPPPPSPSPHAASELYGQGSVSPGASPNRPELAGQYGYLQQQQQQQQQQYPQQYPPQYPQQQQQYPQQQGGYPSPPAPSPQHLQFQQGGYHQGYHAVGGTPPPPPPQQQPIHQYPQSSWQSGPVPGYHEMDAGGHGVGQR